MSWPQTKCEGRQPGEPDCEYCTPVGTMGVAPADDPRYFGGFVDVTGIRHDPLRHADDCPRAES